MHADLSGSDPHSERITSVYSNKKRPFLPVRDTENTNCQIGPNTGPIRPRGAPELIRENERFDRSDYTRLMYKLLLVDVM